MPLRYLAGVLSLRRRRQLILTTTPRLLYVNVSKKKMSGEIPWHPTETHAAATDEHVFTVLAPKDAKGKTHREFYDLVGKAVRWVKKIRNPDTVKELMAFKVDSEHNEYITKQGFLTKRAIRTGRRHVDRTRRHQVRLHDRRRGPDRPDLELRPVAGGRNSG